MPPDRLRASQGRLVVLEAGIGRPVQATVTLLLGARLVEQARRLEITGIELQGAI